MDVKSKNFGIIFFFLSIGLAIFFILKQDENSLLLSENLAKKEVVSVENLVQEQDQSIEKHPIEIPSRGEKIVLHEQIEPRSEDDFIEFNEPGTVSYLRKDNTLNVTPVVANLAKTNFNDVLLELSKDISERSLTKKQELSEVLHGVKSLDSIDYQYECGSGVCAIMVPYVEEQMMGLVSQEILSNLSMGAVFSKNVTKEDGYIEFRTIFGDDPAHADTLTINPALLSGQ
ncbi:MAG: hypothetical protein L3J46_09490 [Kangiellaceae bacterium]|nr:hypothetical protein [Kangiellaceae bacterium]